MASRFKTVTIEEVDFRKVLRLDTHGTKDFSYLIGANLATQKRVAELGQSE